ncbi:hypothetical protein M3223_20490 [Paenibacillus pasadenensis]|uniref:hypothetical protein n=1 Tax=Paenibacillus pasadenensis TaxID=217090 RepID=UPI00203D120F|nr:hypothetical protein [Paenibacillus pasadenensis]MCM3749735.1 hypothetical protein [Paenibacillus pasadenensis]
MKKNSTLGLILIAAGVLVAMKFLGLGHVIGWLVSLLFPVILLGLGYIGWRNGNRLIGGILAFIGAIMLLGKLSGLILALLAIGLIVWGVAKIKDNRSY